MDINLGFYLILIPVILFSLTIHEYAHALVAYKLGDDTAKNQGRLTLNPLPHLDPLGTLLLVIAKFGWAKPVPVNPANFKDPKKGMLLVAIAGPVSNIITSVVSVIILKSIFISFDQLQVYSSIMEPVFTALVWLIFIGIVLAVFNMIPVPPLDGSRVLHAVLPDRLGMMYQRFERYGVLLLFALFIFGGNIFGYILQFPVALFVSLCNFSNGELNLIFSILGNG